MVRREDRDNGGGDRRFHTYTHLYVYVHTYYIYIYIYIYIIHTRSVCKYVFMYACTVRVRMCVLGNKKAGRQFLEDRRKNRNGNRCFMMGRPLFDPPLSCRHARHPP